jgi:hypothetical protein
MDVTGTRVSDAEARALAVRALPGTRHAIGEVCDTHVLQKTARQRRAESKRVCSGSFVYARTPSAGMC